MGEEVRLPLWIAIFAISTVGIGLVLIAKKKTR